LFHVEHDEDALEAERKREVHMRRNPYLTCVTVYQELGRELERHGVSLTELIRLALDELLDDLPNLRELYGEHANRVHGITRKKLRIIERELASRLEMHRAQRSARFLSNLGSRGCPISVMTQRRKELRAMREGDLD
jgi:hypothetical protein